MLTPQRKAWPPAAAAATSFTPHRVGATMSSGLVPSAKGKAVIVADEPQQPPPLGSLSEAGGQVAVGFDAGNIEDWKKFREFGLLDEAVMQRKDQEALLEKVSRLEKEVSLAMIMICAIFSFLVLNSFSRVRFIRCVCAKFYDYSVSFFFAFIEL